MLGHRVACLHLCEYQRSPSQGSIAPAVYRVSTTAASYEINPDDVNLASNIVGVLRATDGGLSTSI